MRYISPFKLFPSIDFSKVEVSSISDVKLKRKAIAEFELNDNQPLEIKGIAIGKSEALRLIESLKEASVLKEHLDIIKEKDLLTFLEGSSTSYIFNSVNKSRVISSLVAEEFVEMYDRVLLQAYKGVNITKCNQILAFPIQELTHGIKSPFEGVLKRLKNDIVNLEQIDGKDGEAQERAIKLIQNDFTRNKLRIINLLPLDFYNSRNRLGLVLINIASSIFNERQNGYLAGKLFRFVEHLDCDEEYKKLAAENFTIVKGESKGWYKDRWRWSWWQLLGVVLISVKLFHYCSKDTSNNLPQPSTLDIQNGIIEMIENHKKNNNQYVKDIKNKISLLGYDSAYRSDGFIGKQLHTGDKIFQVGEVAINHKKRKYSIYNSYSKPIVTGVINISFKFKKHLHRVEKVESSSWYYVKSKDTLVLPRSEVYELVFITGEGWGETYKLNFLAGGNTAKVNDECGFFLTHIQLIEDIDISKSVVGLSDTLLFYNVGNMNIPN